MPLFDYRCSACGQLFEMMTGGEDSLEATCPCGHTVLHKIWIKAPGMVPDFQPYFDQQLGTVVKGRQHLSRLLEDRGLVEASRDEVSRAVASAPSEHPPARVDHEKFQEAAQQAYWDLKTGREPLRQILTPEQVEEGILPSAFDNPLKG